jgi:hypothetical protein
MEAIAADALTVSSNDMTLSAAASLDVSSGGDLNVMSENVAVHSAGILEGTMDKLQISVHDTLDIFSRGVATVASESIDASVQEHVSLTAAGALSAVGESASLEVQGTLGLTGGSATVRLEDSVSAYAGDKVELNTHDVDIQAGGTMSTFAGSSASLVAGAGGISVDSGGKVVLRTADHSLEIDPNGPARLLSTSDVILNSGTLDAAADEVTVSGGSSGRGGTARFILETDCMRAPDHCTRSNDEILDELSQRMSIRRSRLKIRELSSPTLVPTTNRSALPLESTRRIPGQFGRRAQEIEKESNHVGAEQSDGEGGYIGGHARTAEIDAAAMKVKNEKKRIMRHLLTFFKNNPADITVRKNAMLKLLAFESQDDVMQLWQSFRGADDHIPADVMRSFVDRLLSI